MEGISIGTSTQFDTAFEFLEQRLLLVHKEYERIEQREPQLDDEQKQDLLASKSVFIFCLEELQELHSGLIQDLLFATTADPAPLDNIFEAACVEDLSNLLMSDGVEMEVAPHVCSFQKWPSLYEGAVINPGGSCDMESYLCISTSFMIYCIDFGRDWPEGYSSELQPVPITCSVKLLEMGLPASMDLFKLGSDTCMIGGQEFPGFEKRPDLSLYEKYDSKGSSLKTYHLSLALLPEDGLSLSECHNAPLLKRPKSWPIVEQIGNRIHVIESFPSCSYPPGTIPSHEVLDLDELGRGWIKLPSMRHPDHKEQGMFIRHHLVVGDRLYAKIVGGHCRDYLVFDSNTNEWKLHVYDSVPRSTKHVTEFLGVGNLICIGEYERGGEPLYVVIGVRHIPKGDVVCDDREMIAEAHLVTPMGQVFRTQQLPRFFEGFKWPAVILYASLFKQGKTVCAVIQGHATNCALSFLFISTFTVEVVAPKPISALSAHNTTHKYRPSSNATNLLGDFVNVVVKGRRVYQLESELWEEGSAPPCLTACFL